MMVSTSLMAALSWAASWGGGTVETSRLVRWGEDQPGCTFSADDDGKYRYGLWTNDFGIVLAVDSQELQKASRRLEPIFALQLTLHYRGQESLAVTTADISLEFTQHYRDVHKSLDPDNLSAKLKHDADALSERAAEDIRKHPEKQHEQETSLKARQQDIVEMIEFLKQSSLRPITLDARSPEASGWVLFNAKSKWIANWKKQEELILRVPINNQVIEFPFALPPSEGDLILRRRP